LVMIRAHALHLAVMAACVAGLAACGSGQQGQPAATSATAAAPGPAALAPGQHYQASISLVGQPEVSADGQDIIVVVRVTNDGTLAFGTQATNEHNVNLGAHAIDAAGHWIVTNLARGTIPEVAPGQAVKATIQLPVAKVLGHSAEILPVEENVAWFDKWGTKPLVVGPFEACSDPSKGKLCDAQGKPLATATTDP
jgi:hypothetical protein